MPNNEHTWDCRCGECFGEALSQIAKITTLSERLYRGEQIPVFWPLCKCGHSYDQHSAVALIGDDDACAIDGCKCEDYVSSTDSNPKDAR